MQRYLQQYKSMMQSNFVKNKQGETAANSQELKCQKRSPQAPKDYLSNHFLKTHFRLRNHPEIF